MNDAMKMICAAIAGAAIAASGFLAIGAPEHWPEHVVTDDMRAAGSAALEEYKQKEYDSQLGTEEPFVAGGDYLNYGKWLTFPESEVVKLDPEGLPTQQYLNGFGYNPVQVGNYALAEYGRLVAGGSDVQFKKAVEKLLSMQRSDGAFPLQFVDRHYTQAYPYQPGWVDGMTPGIVLSAYARAYEHTKDRKWVTAGNKVLKFMQKPFPKGGMGNLGDLDPSLSGYIYFLEYPAVPQNYTLNGFMFALTGLYEWSEIAKSDEAKELFERGISTLEHVLPYYDIGTFSSYDLSYITYSRQWYLRPQGANPIAFYHMVHIYQLRALASVTGSKVLKEYADRWQSYVE